MFTTSSVVADTLSLCMMPTRIPLLDASTMKASPSVMQGGACCDLVMKSVVSSHVKLFFVEDDPSSSAAIAGDTLCTRLISCTSICVVAWGVPGETCVAQPGRCYARISLPPISSWLRFSPNHSVTRDFITFLCGSSSAGVIPSNVAALSRRCFIETCL